MYATQEQDGGYSRYIIPTCIKCCFLLYRVDVVTILCWVRSGYNATIMKKLMKYILWHKEWGQNLKNVTRVTMELPIYKHKLTMCSWCTWCCHSHQSDIGEFGTRDLHRLYRGGWCLGTACLGGGCNIRTDNLLALRLHCRLDLDGFRLLNLVGSLQ